MAALGTRVWIRTHTNAVQPAVVVAAPPSGDTVTVRLENGQQATLPAKDVFRTKAEAVEEMVRRQVRSMGATKIDPPAAPVQVGSRPGERPTPSIPVSC